MNTLIALLVSKTEDGKILWDSPVNHNRGTKIANRRVAFVDYPKKLGLVVENIDGFNQLIIDNQEDLKFLSRTLRKIEHLKEKEVKKENKETKADLENWLQTAVAVL